MPTFVCLSNARACWLQAQDALKPIEVNSSSTNSLETTYPKPYFDRSLRLNNYQHWYEGTIPKGINSDGIAYSTMKLNVTGCAPSAYMMAKALIDPNFKISVDEYKKAIDGMGTNKTGTTLDQIAVYAKAQYGESHYGLMSTTDRERAKKAIQVIIDKNRPLIANVRVSGTSVVTKGGANHVVVVYGLKQTPNGGTVYYADPLEKDAKKGKKSLDYSTFLDSMNASGAYYWQSVGLLDETKNNK